MTKQQIQAVEQVLDVLERIANAYKDSRKYVILEFLEESRAWLRRRMHETTQDATKSEVNVNG
jgi:hypothetical protein